ncbi:two-component system chemotaxis sensor kinase CheA [Thiogranum longum]|uniref:Chemotaxis protein CheA n=1 Tax=Thiogranum longum TaxID=1537524 RepID=A0A4R1HA69_9GAMM|nr:chemotaxis protein CheA [Thiogranum longum]TCK18824.1 two-component system chemotaxis sensor kinase CheA [Thiogranum longum]
MSLDTDDEILQDFLVEAGEILERLNEELVELEQSPDDMEMLNGVFRSFHTIKGGASFLSLDGLVDVCHRAEDVFNILRNGERSVDGDLMDTVLQVLDVVNNMFAEVQGGEMPTPAEASLLNALEKLAVPEATAPPEPDVSSAPDSGATGVSTEIQGDEVDSDFEAMLDQAGSAIPTGQKASVVGGDDITEDEFEALLDQLHGDGKGPVAHNNTDNEIVAAPASGKSTPAASDDITEDEFDALLDQLHGEGKGPAMAAEKADVSEPSTKTEPEPQVTEKKAAPEKTKAKPAVASASKTETSVRVDTSRLDEIMNMVGELVLARNRLSNLKESLANEDVSMAIANLDVVTADLQNAVMKTRMQPIKKVFGRFPRVVRDLARSLDKEVNLEMQGEETDLDKNLVEALADPLVHLVRNAVDHGIETPDEREAKGKPRQGTVVLAAEQEGDHILLSIDDDGKGMDADVLRRKAVEKGMMDADSAARLDDRECFNLIFAAGFSTKDQISDVSGRGVGMDVVKTRIGQLNGSVEVDSEPGKGSRLTIRVPLTLAIMPTLMVKLGEQPFALPLGSVSEIFDLDTERTNIVDGQLVVMVRDKALPLFYLRDWLVTGSGVSQEDTVNHVVVVHVGSRKVGFVVEQLVGQEEVVIKPLGAFLQGLAGFAGATITGDGRIALILDVPSLMKAYSSHM